MKLNSVPLLFALAIIAVLTFCLWKNNSPDGKTVMNLNWDSTAAVKIAPDSMRVSFAGPSSATFMRSPSAPGDEKLFFHPDLFRIPNPPVRWHFVVTGMASYENLPNQSELQVTACYMGGNTVVGMDLNSGANKNFAGSSSTRRFVIPVEELSHKGELLQLDIALSIAGNSGNPPLPAGAVEKLTLSDLKLVRYPDSSPPASPSDSIATSGLDWKSFFLGIAAAAILCMAIAHSLLLARRLRKMKDDAEIRQMSSLDG